MKHWSGLSYSCCELRGLFWVVCGWLKPVVEYCDYTGKRFSKSKALRWQNTWKAAQGRSVLLDLGLQNGSRT